MVQDSIMAEALYVIRNAHILKSIPYQSASVNAGQAITSFTT